MVVDRRMDGHLIGTEGEDGLADGYQGHVIVLGWVGIEALRTHDNVRADEGGLGMDARKGGRERVGVPRGISGVPGDAL